MTTLNFMPQFASRVERGIKTQTIRKPRKVRIKVGDKVHLYTGLRTKECRALGVGIVREVIPVTIYKDAVGIADRLRMDIIDLADFAMADGFGNWVEMRDWFRNQYGLPFRGNLIKWEKILA